MPGWVILDKRTGSWWGRVEIKNEDVRMEGVSFSVLEGVRLRSKETNARAKARVVWRKGSDFKSIRERRGCPSEMCAVRWGGDFGSSSV